MINGTGKWGPFKKRAHLGKVTPQVDKEPQRYCGGILGTTRSLSNAPPKRRERRLCRTTLRKLLLRRGYHFSLALQPFTERSRVRHCVACGSRVRNKNLGGNGGRSALTGPVWCLDCADFSRQLTLSLGGRQ